MVKGSKVKNCWREVKKIWKEVKKMLRAIVGKVTPQGDRRNHQKIMKSFIGNKLFSYVNYFQLVILYKNDVYSEICY